jgi:DNA-nicking Smr family endonuclease
METKVNFIDDEDKKAWNDFTKNVKKNVSPQMADKFFKPSKKIKLREDQSFFIFSDSQKNSNHSVIKLHKKDLKGFFIERKLDLHGKTLEVAINYVDSFTKDCYLKQIKMALIITGKGEKNEGILKQTLPDILKNYSNYVIGYCIADLKDGGEGALYIRFRKKR